MLRIVIFAASAAALILTPTAAARPVIDNEGYAYLTESLLGSRATGKNERIEVESWQWGATRSGGNNQLKLDDSAGSSPATTGRVTGLATDPADPNAASYNPYSIKKLSDRSTSTFAKPLPRGSLTVKGQLPGCTIGKRYGGMQFGASGMRYELKDVVISNCAPGEVSLDYAKVTVRGWDPKKKEE